MMFNIINLQEITLDYCLKLYAYSEKIIRFLQNANQNKMQNRKTYCQIAMKNK